MTNSLLYPNIDSSLPIISHGKGAILYDQGGKDYIDGSSGAMIANIGHGNEKIAAIAHDQARKIAFAYRAQFRNEPAETLAEQLVELSGDHSRAFFLNSGSEAIDAAIRIALQYWKTKGKPEKRLVVGRNISNHGNTVASLSVAANKRREEIADITLDISEIKVATPYCYRCPLELSKNTCSSQCADQFEQALIHAGPENVAAFIAEPITGAAGGALVPGKDYFPKIGAICNKYNVLLIADEVVTGLGRSGKWYGMHNWGTKADITVLGKGLNAGYAPISAILVVAHVIDSIADGDGSISVGHTHSSNPLSSAIASGVVDILREQDIVNAIGEKEIILRQALEILKKKYPIIGDVRGKGLLHALEFVSDSENKKPFDKKLEVTKLVVASAFEKGLIVYPCRGLMANECGDAILLAPPLTIGASDMNVLIDRLDQALSVVSETLAHYLPKRKK